MIKDLIENFMESDQVNEYVGPFFYKAKIYLFIITFVILLNLVLVIYNSMKLNKVLFRLNQGLYV